MPKGEAAVRPADCQSLNHWVPLHLGHSVLASSDLEVGDDGALVAHENDTGQAGGHSKHHVDLAVAPGR